MQSKSVAIVLSIAILLFITTSGQAAPAVGQLGNDFSYQGRLDRDGQPYTGTCDFQFSLWDAETEGREIGETINLDDLPVTKGLFTTTLDYGTLAFSGEARWLGIAVQCPGDSGFTTFPRQKLTAAPYALYATSAPWGGLMGVPASFADGVDDNTTYSAGEGLSLSTTTFSIDPTYTQRRVNFPCGFGNNVRQINEDGSLACQADGPLNRTNAPTTNTLISLDTGGNVGMHTSITINPWGLGLISYYDGTNGDLKVAACWDPSCSSATATTLDSSGDVGSDTSITIGADGLGLISYYDSTNSNLKVAHCSDTTCSSATPSTLDASGNVGATTSITIGADGLGLISYYDNTNGNLKVAHCSDTTCSSATPSTLDSSGNVGAYTSITLGADGLGLISYLDVTNWSLKVAHCSDTTCSSATPYILDSTAYGMGQYTSITTGTDGLGLISYFDANTLDLKVAHCSDIACSSAILYTLDSTGSVGYYTSITIGADGMGLISYYDSTNGNLKVSHCSNINCSSATSYTLDSTGWVGLYTSITIGADGLGLISYWDETNDNLKVAHCSDPFCIPYFRRR